MTTDKIIKSLRVCKVGGPYDSPTPDLTRQLQRLVTEERPGATNKTLMRLMRQQAAELNRRDRLLKEQEAAIQTALDAAEERRQAAAYEIWEGDEQNARTGGL